MIRVLAIASTLGLLACGGGGKSIAEKESDDAWKIAERSAKQDEKKRANAKRSPVVTPKRLCVADASAPDPGAKKTDAKNKGLPPVGATKPGQQPPPKPPPTGMRGMGLARGRGLYDKEKRKLPMHMVPYDKDNDGEISDSERRNMIRDLAGNLFLRLDTNKDNRVSVLEARAACGTRAAIYVGKYASRDVDKDGYLSRYELENAYDKLTPK